MGEKVARSRLEGFLQTRLDHRPASLPGFLDDRPELAGSKYWAASQPSVPFCATVIIGRSNNHRPLREALHGLKIGPVEGVCPGRLAQPDLSFVPAHIDALAPMAVQVADAVGRLIFTSVIRPDADRASCSPATDFAGSPAQALRVRNTRKRQFLRIGKIPRDFAVEQA